MTKLSYKSSGVDIKRGDLVSKDAFLKLQQTFTSQTKIFRNIIAIKNPINGAKNSYLALASDGVGTKLQYVYGSNKTFSVGVDVVAMCVNDLARNNIKPLGFALYRAAGRFHEKQMSEVVKGVVKGCLQAGCVYATGESAEMPGIYQKEDFDLAGFAVGVFEKNDLITGENIKQGDVVIGLAASGLHSNGFSLIRKIFPPDTVEKNSKLYKQLIEPTRIYVKPVLEVTNEYKINGWAHITGSGLVGKLGKILPEGLSAELKKGSWDIPEIFKLIQLKGKLTEKEMYNTFNMGVGFVGIIPEELADKIINFLKATGENVFAIGAIKKSKNQKVSLIV